MSTPWVLRHAVLRVLLVLVALWGLAFGLTMPFLTLTASDRGVSVGAIGVIAASYLLTQIVLQFPFGALADRVGRIGPLAAGITLFSLAPLGGRLADRGDY
jgi:MFS family permease